ncbi:sulfotransferase family 2 domain-containing protein [Brevundimonas sp.]|uniref:sulfotransferase family 2 domain-containing protein n=1 Tax=Brevundimonas sp. TaxID=1871086 RepID=UPI00289B877E|nr:sulfotransferase family 2 domain-containing protein [Brevundimonas sp.]
MIVSAASSSAAGPKRYDPAKLLVSLHIPKTAGTSFRAILGDWFGERLHNHYPGWATPLTRTDAQADACVHGHFTRRNDSAIHQYYPDADQVITIMRDPFDRAISEWRFKNMIKSAGNPVDEMEDDPSFDTWFGRRADEVAEQPITRLMMQMPESLTPETAHMAFDHSFVAVGVCERFPETIRLFATLLGKPHASDVRMNVTTYGSANDYDAYRSRHEQVFHSDHEMYAAARAMFERQLADAEL